MYVVCRCDSDCEGVGRKKIKKLRKSQQDKKDRRRARGRGRGKGKVSHCTDSKSNSHFAMLEKVSWVS